jgi:hypothetical protein
LNDHDIRVKKADRISTKPFGLDWKMPAKIGNSPQDIADSLRYNRPQTTAEEQELLDVVRKQLDGDELCAGARPLISR